MHSLSEKESRLFQKIESFLSQGEKITVRLLQKSLGYASPRSISVLMDSLQSKGWIYRSPQGSLGVNPARPDHSYRTRSIPLVGNIACGAPMLAEENITTHIPVSENLLRDNAEYFFLRANGDSMNQKGIEDGDLVLIQRTAGYKNGDIVVAVINDEATLKEYRNEKGIVYLIPHSDNPIHTPIILDGSEGDIFLQGIFIRNFPGSLF